jgi:hypothetical protein
MRHDFSKTRFRSSQTGKLMTDPRSKSEILSETTKDYLVQVFINMQYGRQKDIASKYLLKGTLVEDNGITLLSRIHKEFYVKNEDHLSNDFLTGTPDIITDNSIIDIKCSWDIFTFWKSKTGAINKDYYFQLQSYMDLTGKTEAQLCYCLVNTPDNLIEGEKRKLQWSTGIMEGELSAEMLEAIEKNCKFDDIPIEERIHIINIQRNQDDINRLHERVIQCREYLNSTFNQ